MPDKNSNETPMGPHSAGPELVEKVSPLCGS